MKKTIIICVTTFLTIVCSMLLFGFFFISQQNRVSKNETSKIKDLEKQVNEYEKCAKKSSRINIQNLSGAVLVDDVVTMYQIPAYKAEELKELQKCLSKIYNK